MHIILLEVAALFAVMLLPLFVLGKRLSKKTKTRTKRAFVYRIDTDTSDARYAINEHGFLEEINAGKLSKDRYQ